MDERRGLYEDPLNAARTIVVSTIFGVAFWAAIIYGAKAIYDHFH